MDNNRWNIFLSLQGNEEDTPPPEKSITRPFDYTNAIMIDLGVFEYFSNKSKIMVIGTGDGSEAMCFITRGFDTIGTTLHHSDKKFAKNEYGIDLLIEDMHYMKSIRSEHFDGIYSYHVLEHSISPIIALYEMRRILKVGGKIFCVIPSSGTSEETGLQHYSVLQDELWYHLLNIVGFDDIQITKASNKSKDCIIIKATKGTSRDCPGKYFDKEFQKYDKDEER